MPSVPPYVPSRIGEGHFTDFQAPASGSTDNGKVWAWNSTTSKFEPTTGITFTGSGILSLSTALVSPIIRPASDSAAAVKITNAAGTSDVFVVDTISGNIGIGKSSGITQKLWVKGGTRIEDSSSSNYQTFSTVGVDAVWNLPSKSASIKGSSTETSPASSVVVIYQNTSNTDNNSSGIAFRNAGGNTVSGVFGVNSSQSGNVGYLSFMTRSAGLGLTEYMRLTDKLDVFGTVQMDGLRVDVTPTAETVTCTHTITISANGTNYKIPCVAA